MLQAALGKCNETLVFVAVRFTLSTIIAYTSHKRKFYWPVYLSPRAVDSNGGSGRTGWTAAPVIGL